MISAEENETLVRVGPGTAMGELMREYWIPACLSSELEADGAPLRIPLLGEKLIAFRDSEGRVGVMDHRCPHRCASLFFGRNEEGGLRCIYHGWKFDVDGNCLEMPNVPPGRRFEDRVKAKAYPTVERNGVIWTYMGKRQTPPPLPVMEALMVPEGEMYITCALRECNWLQVLEGDIDTSHFGFLHAGHIADEDVDPDDLNALTVLNKHPDYHVELTDWGSMYAAYRPSGDNYYYRVAHFLFPFWTMFPDGKFSKNVVADAYVPLDDTHTMVYNWLWKKREGGLRTLKDGSPIAGLETFEQSLPPTSDWFGRWRGVANRDNDYLIDRTAQKHTVFSGVQSVTVQDQVVNESMGEIVDRTLEHLTISDLMVTRTRKRMLKAVRDHKDGAIPPGVDNPEVYTGARSGAYVAPKVTPWKEAYAEEMVAGEYPSRASEAAE